MSRRLKIPAGGWVLVGDGRKALVLRNEGDDVFPNLRIQQTFEAPFNPPTRDQGTDKPARAIYGGRRSPTAQPDWHDLAEHRFATEVADALEKVRCEGPIKSLIVAAPPRTLAVLRKAFSDNLKRLIVAEIDKELTKHPVHEIERHLTE